MTINVATIRESFEIAKPIANQVVNRFYENLFADFPESPSLFVNVDMTKQKAALLGSLIAAVDNLDKPDTLTKFLLGLGARHGKYGIQDVHYEWVGQSLLKTFGQFFGSAWTDDLRGQWAEVYGVIADTMKKGSRAAGGGTVTPISRERVSAPEPVAQVQELDVPPLPEDLKQAIRAAVKAAIQKQIKTEIHKCFQDELNEVAKTTKDILSRKVG